MGDMADMINDDTPYDGLGPDENEWLKDKLAEQSRRLEVLDAEKLDWIAAGERQDAELKDWKDTVVNLKLSLEQRDEEIEALTECLNGSSKATYTAEVFDKMRAKKDAEIARLESMIPLVKDMEAKDRIIKACGEALKEAIAIEKHYAPYTGCHHTPETRCDGLCQAEAEVGMAIQRHIKALKLIKDAEK